MDNGFGAGAGAGAGAKVVPKLQHLSETAATVIQRAWQRTAVTGALGKQHSTAQRNTHE
jgi:hypothetical protein